RESVRRKPFDHRVRVEERPIDPLGGRTQHAVKPDGVCRHDRLPLAGSLVKIPKTISASWPSATELVYRKFLPLTSRPRTCGLTRRQPIAISQMVAVGCSLITQGSAR